MLQEVGFDVSVLAFERPYHQGRMPTAPVTSLGRIEHGRYLSRALRMLSALPRARRALRGARIAYASGQDMALFAIVASAGLRVSIVLEVGDLRRVQVASGIKGAIVRYLDRQIAKRSCLLVVTAMGFVEGYYRDRLGIRTPWLLIENKLDAAGAPPMSPVRQTVRELRPTGTIRIGYFGVLRCRWSWEVLREIARRSGGRFEIVIAGYCMEPVDLPREASKEPHMTYRGTYRSSEDLSGLYGSVDMVWACYPGPEHRDPQWRWAQAVCRSNRFYESCHFKTPLITLAESADGSEVARLGVGIALPDASIDAIWRVMSAIDEAKVFHWREQMYRLPTSAGVYTDEPKHLRAALMRFAR
jgi:succinoglycan biosynthesis protein ExoL